MQWRQEDVRRTPELKGHEILATNDDLEKFFGKLRRDWYGPHKIDYKEYKRQMLLWMTAGTHGNTAAFWTVTNEEESPANDGWGKYTLYRCIVVKVATVGASKTYVLKEPIEMFSH